MAKICSSARCAAKRGRYVVLNLKRAAAADQALGEITALDEALVRLDALDHRQSRSRAAVLRWPLLQETAEALNVSLATVKRELRGARVARRELGSE
jgi:DNA-directed RNA polymerase specialized sigma24 family protein